MSNIFKRSIQIDKDRRKKRDELLLPMEEYDRTVHFQALERLRKDCEKEGHNEGKWRNNGCGRWWNKCGKCGATLDEKIYVYEK
jgi:hypothetical protein